jgi:N2-(2-carboxyethyl)arginine synthase
MEPVPAAATMFDLIVDELIAHGITRVFGVLGREASDLSLSALRRIEFVPFRHEFSAGLVAEVMARRSRTPQVVMVTLGPGATNVATAVCSAYLDRSPLVVLAAQAESWDLHYGRTHQSIDQVKVFEPITKFSYQLSPSDAVIHIIRRAIHVATAEPPGPVLVSLPMDLLSRSQESAPIATLEGVPNSSLSQADSDFATSEAIDLLQSAVRPVVIVGSQVLRLAFADSVRQALNELRLPTFTTYNAKGIVPEDAPYAMGAASPYASAILGFDIFQEVFVVCDLVLLLGTDYAEDIRPSLWSYGPHKRVVLASPTPELYPEPIRKQFIVIPSVIDAIRALRPAAHSGWSTAPLPSLAALKASAIERFDCDSRPSDVNAAALLHGVSLLSEYDVLVVDVGLHRAIAAVLCTMRNPERFLTSMGASTFGFAIPAATGVSLLQPSARVLAICGDGGLHAALSDLGSLRRIGASFDILLITDNNHGLISLYQQRGQNRYDQSVTSCGPADFVAMGRSLGFRAAFADDADSALARLDHAATARSLTMVCVRTAYPIELLSRALTGAFRDFIRT